MNMYIEMKQRQQAEVNAFPMKFAFTQESLEQGMHELGLDPKKDMDKIVAIPGGGFIRERDKQAFLDLFARHDKEREEAIAADKDGTGYLYHMFRYELANHEYAYTRDVSDTLDALGYTLKEIAENHALTDAFLSARQDYLEEAKKKGWG